MYPMVWIPVCGCDGVTYTNSSAAACNGITTYTMGVCSGATATRTPLPSPGNGRTWPYPVPARGVVYFGVELGADASVRAEVLNARGRLVTVLSGTLSAGSGRLTLNLRGFAPGVYYYKLKISYADGRVENLPVRSFVVRR
jgi:hypothetical protein